MMELIQATSRIHTSRCTYFSKLLCVLYVAAALMDYVPYAQSINMTQVRASDEEAKDALPTSGRKGCNRVKNDSPEL